jgi:hypothetical protein
VRNTDPDPVCGKGVVNSDQWIQVVYLTLSLPAEYFPDEQSVKSIHKKGATK